MPELLSDRVCTSGAADAHSLWSSLDVTSLRRSAVSESSKQRAARLLPCEEEAADEEDDMPFTYQQESAQSIAARVIASLCCGAKRTYIRLFIGRRRCATTVYQRYTLRVRAMLAVQCVQSVMSSQRGRSGSAPDVRLSVNHRPSQGARSDSVGKLTA